MVNIWGPCGLCHCCSTLPAIVTEDQPQVIHKQMGKKIHKQMKMAMLLCSSKTLFKKTGDKLDLVH